MADRFEQLETYVHQCIEATLNNTRPEVYEELMPVLETSGARLKKYFVRVLLEQFDRAVASELKAHQIPQKLSELQTAEERARVRQINWLESPTLVAKNEQPVVLPRLSTRDLVDCQLRSSREKWLSELEQRLVHTKEITNESRIRVEQQKTVVEARLKRIEERLKELEKTRDLLNVGK